MEVVLAGAGVFGPSTDLFDIGAMLAVQAGVVPALRARIVLDAVSPAALPPH